MENPHKMILCIDDEDFIGVGETIEEAHKMYVYEHDLYPRDKLTFYECTEIKEK